MRYSIWGGRGRKQKVRRADGGGGNKGDANQSTVTTTRKIRKTVENVDARCDNVHQFDEEEMISERERTYIKLKKFWVRHVGMKRRESKRALQKYCA